VEAPLIEDVADTAFWIAQYRAEETARPDALFRDPLAARLAGDRGKHIARRMPSGFYVRWAVAIRTPIIDDYVRAALAHGVDTVVNLGAGLDTRPYRLDLPLSLRWIEVDQPRVIAFKEERLRDQTPRCHLERTSLDLSDASARRAFLANVSATSKRALVVTEGVIAYLDSADVAALAHDLRDHPCFQEWVVDYHSPLMAKLRRRRGMSEPMKNAPFKFQPPDWFRFFEDNGWRTAEMRYLPEESEKLGRPLPVPFWMRLRLKVLRVFSSAPRREAYRKLAGFGLLEPIPRPE
jgi:methyltransferase (TIGR00027 family)